MEHISYHRNGFAACEEIRRCSPSPFFYCRGNPVLCPKPLRVRASSRDELCDSAASAEILEILLTKDNYDSFDQHMGLPVASPPYFCGSPPVRAANPIVHDSGFLQGKHYKQFIQPTSVEITNNPLTTMPMSSAGARSCSSKSFGPNPDTVRIEGFNCLNRDGRGCSISAFA